VDESTDPVSGLPWLGADAPALQALAADGRRVLFAEIALDRFVGLVDGLGEDTAGRALAVAADRIAAFALPQGRLWRLRGACLLLATDAAEVLVDPEAWAQRLLDELVAPLSVPPYTLEINASIGLSLFPDDAPTLVAALSAADRALYAAQRSGVGRALRHAASGAAGPSVPVFTHALAKALARDELELHYQPFVDAADGRIAGVEALLRWRAPDGRLLAPPQFLPRAEQLGLMRGISGWVLDRVIADARHWRRAGFDDLRIAVNVSTVQLLEDDLVNQLETRLAAADVAFDQFEIELSESTLLRDVDRIRDTLRRLRSCGVGLTLDDFGMGGAGLVQLPRYPLSKIKIDRDFTGEIAHDQGQAAIARAIIAMGRQLHLKVMAEGVESEAQVGYLRRADCDQLQGFLFSGPKPLAEVDPLLRQRYLRPELFAQGAASRTLLLVDDEENVLRALQRVFRRDGYRVLAASRVQEAFELLASNEVQVIVSDQRMNDVSGTEFLGRVKELYPRTVRLILSGYTDLATVTEAINKGAIYRFLTKPWDEEDLRHHIREAFRTWEGLQ
jgi:EAL domain-containing protein (putative c-di-GMP-specific phosphodiesterase class I)/ActR/RegA family two-component response regulator/GGDEF domain-containing protein